MKTFANTPDELGRLLLRIAIGAMWISHGLVLKALAFGLDGFAGWLVSIGLPAWLARPIIAAEVLGGLLILLGWHGRFASMLLLPILFGATWIHAGNGWVFSNADGGWEYPLFLIAASIAHALLGDGRLALRRELARA